MSKVRDILGPDRDSEFLLSFARVGIQTESENEEPKSVYMLQKPDLTKQLSEGKSEGSGDKTPRRSKSSLCFEITSNNKNKSKRKGAYFDEIYTDKDRAAAVSIGSYDIKQSLNIKRRQDRHEALQLPDEVEPGALLALGNREFKNGNIESSLKFISKALELNSDDINALVARSKCFLLLGEPTKGLLDAETALLVDKDNIRAIYQKAESLYFMGQFEHSLMFFYRGLRLRPELNSFRLGVQKTQEAIEKTIGGFPTKKSSIPQNSSKGTRNNNNNNNNTTANTITTTLSITKPTNNNNNNNNIGTVNQSKQQKSEQKSLNPNKEQSSTINNNNIKSLLNNNSNNHNNNYGVDTTKKIINRPKTTSLKISAEKREARKLLGELCVDKEYLENLLKHPDLKRADTGSENISILAKEAVNFLNNRQEFWRQQRPCTALPPSTIKQKKQCSSANTGNTTTNGANANGSSSMPKWF